MSEYEIENTDDELDDSWITAIEEEERLISPLFSIVSEPEGEPVSRYVSTTLLKICFDLLFNSAYKFSDIVTNIGILN